MKDYRQHVVATLFGQVTVRLPRFRCATCGGIEAAVDWPSYCRATPELLQLQAHLSATMTYRTAADLLEQMFPVKAAKHSETVRRHTLKVGEALQKCAVITPGTMAPAVVVTLDSTFIRSCETGEQHLEVRVGNVETKSGGRQVFGAVTKTETDIKVLINQNLDAVGRTEETTLTAFTDGCSGLRRILAGAGVTDLPFLDCWGGRPHGIEVPELGCQKPRPEPSMSHITRIGIDTSKAVFTLHCVDDTGRAVLQTNLRRAQMVAFFKKLPPPRSSWKHAAVRIIGGGNSAPLAITFV